MRNYFFGAALIGFAMAATSALARPPYFSDDPEPTDYQHFEIYAFGDGTITQDGNAGSAGIDFNYGGLPDLQLTAVLPLGYQSSASAHFDTGLATRRQIPVSTSRGNRMGCRRFPTLVLAEQRRRGGAAARVPPPPVLA